MCDTPIARITGCLSFFFFFVACTRVNTVVLISLCAQTLKPVFEGGQNLTAVEGNASPVHQVYPVVSRITGEGRAEILRAWGAGFEQGAAGGWGGPQPGTAVVEGMHPLLCHLRTFPDDSMPVVPMLTVTVAPLRNTKTKPRRQQLLY